MVERFDYIELQLEPKLPKLQTPIPLDPNSSKVLLIAVGVWVNEWFAVLSEGWVKLVLVCRIYRKNFRGLILKANGLKRGHTIWFVTYCFEWCYRRHIEGLVYFVKIPGNKVSCSTLSHKSRGQGDVFRSCPWKLVWCNSNGWWRKKKNGSRLYIEKRMKGSWDF